MRTIPQGKYIVLNDDELAAINGGDLAANVVGGAVGGAIDGALGGPEGVGLGALGGAIGGAIVSFIEWYDQQGFTPNYDIGPGMGTGSQWY